MNNKRSTESLESFKAKTVKFHIYRGISVGSAPHPHGNPVRPDPIPRYYGKCGLHYRRFQTVTAVFTPSPLSCRPLLHSRAKKNWF